MLKMSLLALLGASALVLPHAHRAPATVHYAVAPEGNEARYRVREQLLHHDLPNDAIGKTTAITGGITFNADGTIDTAASKITIDVTSLKSDKDASLAQPRVPVVLSVADTIKLEYDFHFVREK